MRLGVGLGWNKLEYEALGQDFHTRGKRIEEQVELLRRLWREPLVTFEGRFDRVPDAGLNPLPGRQIPIWFGAVQDVALRRAARLGDGWMVNLPRERGGEESIHKIHDFLAEVGRERAEFGVDARLSLKQGVDHTLEEARKWEELGATHLSINTMGQGNAWPEGHLQAAQEFAAAYQG
jgi:alkanesulfonate monooxygenase SsuD/methylene tetrahydromethanopterin reductase-like flavin-dependent oxidoreductase (luciferase family)